MEKIMYDEIREQQNKHWWFRGRREIVIDYAKRWANFKADANNKILDVGCGMGFLLCELKDYGQVFGMDAEIEAVDYCRSTFVGGGKNFCRIAA